MFGFINDYLKKFNLKNDNFKLILIDGNFVCVQGFKSILKIEETQIVLKINSGEISFCGQNLAIKELGQSEIFITGDILKIER